MSEAKKINSVFFDYHAYSVIFTDPNSVMNFVFPEFY